MRTLTIALALALAGPALAQGAPAFLGPAPLDGGAAAVPTRVSARVVRALGSPSAEARAEALHAAMTLTVEAPGGADLGPAVPALLAVAQSDPDGRLRVMAVRALEAAGDEGAMAALRAGAGAQTDPAVRRLLFLVLVDHYGVDGLRGDPSVDALVRAIRAHGLR